MSRENYLQAVTDLSEAEYSAASPHVEIDGRSNVTVRMLPLIRRYQSNGDTVSIRTSDDNEFVDVSADGKVKVRPAMWGIGEVTIPSIASHQQNLEVRLASGDLLAVHSNGAVIVADPSVERSMNFSPSGPVPSGMARLNSDGSFKNDYVTVSADGTVVVRGMPGIGTLEIRSDGRMLKWNVNDVLVFEGHDVRRVSKYDCARLEFWNGKAVIRQSKNLPPLDQGLLLEVLRDRNLMGTVIVRVGAQCETTKNMQYYRWEYEEVDIDTADPRVWRLGCERPVDESVFSDGEVAVDGDDQDLFYKGPLEPEEPLDLEAPPVFGD